MYKKDTDIREFFTIKKKEKENEKQLNNIKHIASFSDKQQYAFEKYKNGDNIFITGSGGCGKSYLIHKIYKDAIENRKNIHITAMTGCAAILLDCNATTINTWGSLGICEDDFEKIIKKIRMYKKKDNWLNTDILVIDEISMMNQYMFEMIDKIAKTLRKNKQPFGGIQVIFSGDFYQLPPVFNNFSDIKEKKCFCFESPLWKDIFKESVLLTYNFRQDNDKIYMKILEEIRNDNLSIDNIERLLDCTKKDKETNIPTLLFPKKNMVDDYNLKQFNKLENKSIKIYKPSLYKKKDNNYEILKKETKANNTLKTKFMKNNLIEEEIKLCVGCKVMVTANIDFDKKIVNGSQGIIVDFVDNYPLIEFKDKESTFTHVIEPYSWKSQDENYKIEHIPLILSWAITIHKSQGITLDSVRVNLGSSVFEYGQSYVALSRVKTLDGLYLESINFKKIKTNPKVIKFYKQFQK